MTDEQQKEEPTANESELRFIREIVKRIEAKVDHYDDKVTKRVDHVETTTHARITGVEKSLNETRETVADLNVKASGWTSIGGALVSIGAALMTLIMLVLKGGK